MQETEDDKLDSATGGDKKELTVEEQEALDEALQFDQLRAGFERLKGDERRRTFARLSHMYEEDLPPEMKKGIPGEKILPPPPLQSPQVQVPLRTNSSNVKQVVQIDQSDKKLPRFSGAEKPAQGEVTHKRWHRAATRLVDDQSIPEEQKKRCLFKSLLGTADDVADQYRDETASQIVFVLEQQYGDAIDGDELLAQFYNMMQDDKQSASDYLSSLFVELGEVVKKGGANAVDMTKLLLQQFNRGTTDYDLLVKLRLEDQQTIDNPPNFPALIGNIRKEECKRTERRLRHKRNLRSQAAVVPPRTEVKVVPEPSVDVVRLQKRIAELEAAESPRQEPQSESEVVQLLQNRVAELERKVKVSYRFCYRCGDDSHIATDCNSPPNKVLVQQKVDARRKRRTTNLN